MRKATVCLLSFIPICAESEAVGMVIIMKPFVTYKISGVQGDIISGDIRSFAVTDDLIETVEISQTDDAICGLKFILKDTITPDNDIVAKVTNKAKVFFVNMYGKLQPSIRAFNLEVKKVYDPNLKQTDNKVSNTICLDASLSSIRKHRIDTFRDFFGKKSLRPDADDTYMLLFNIMKIDNIVTRYLFQYEILLNLVAPNHSQKEITDFIRDVYNPTKPSDKIGFHQTRKPGKTYAEDDITYYRNLLAHNDASEEVTDDKINLLFSNALAEILLFALNRN